MSLAATLAAYDEAALSVLANKGLVRRAARDVEEGKVALSGWDGDAALVAADGERVRIDARGPARAECSCPAPGVCRHRIAAVLLLQSGAQAAEVTAPPLAEEIAAIPEEALLRFAGRAGWRAALEIAAAGAEIVEADAALVVRLSGEEHEVRYLRGLGVAGMVSKAPPARRKTLHAAALIAVRRQSGVEPAEAAAEAVEVAAPIDPAFLADVRAALAEACRTALSLAPIALEERLFMLSVSSRADALPRLGAMLRGIAAAIRDRRTRSLRFDPDEALDRIAAADALVRALVAVEDAERRAALLGTVRQRYAEVGPLHLHGFGAERWRTDGGARGVTAHFYDAEADRWFAASLARGAGQDPGFDPGNAYAREAIWGGVTLARLAGSELRLDRASASPQGRLSTAGEARPAIIGDTQVSPAWNCVLRRWRDLADRLRARLAGSLVAPPGEELVVLDPRRTGEPWFDDLAQMLRWPVEDDEGVWLQLSLPYDPDRASHFDLLASTLLRPRFGGAIVVAASAAGTNFALRPIALVEAGVRSLDFEETGKRSIVSGFLARLGRGQRAFSAVPPAAGRLLLDRIAGELTGAAETGCRREALGRLGGLAERADAAGLRTVAEALAGIASAADPAPQLLAARFCVDQSRRQLTALPLVER
jgi:hypothetical protein